MVAANDITLQALRGDFDKQKLYDSRESLLPSLISYSSAY